MKIRKLSIIIAFSFVVQAAYSQSNYLFTKTDFRDVLVSCKDIEFSGKKAFVEFKSSKYEGLYDLMGNLNKLDQQIPLGDFKVDYAYSTTESDGKSAIGMSYMTSHKDSRENFVFNFMISPEGDLWFYADKPEKFAIPLPEKNYAIEPCASVKKGDAINYISVVRKNRAWFLIVNNDTVKRVIEPAYKSANSSADITAQAPLKQYESNILLHKGKQKVQFISGSQTFYTISSEMDEVVSLLKGLTGFYSMNPDCKVGSSSYIFDIQVQYSQEGFDHKVLITGITKQPRYYYLVKNNISNSWYCDLNENDVIIYQGDKFKIKRLLFYPSGDYSTISFKLERREATLEGIYSFDCDYAGSKRK